MRRAEQLISESWHKVAELDELADRQTKVVIVGAKTLALTRIGGSYGAIDNACPHQDGPLGEGSLDASGCLQCPWHGWTFDAFTGEGAKGNLVPSYPVQVRTEGVYVRLEPAAKAPPTVSELMVQTMVNWGIRHVFGMVGHSNLGLAEAIRQREEKGELTYIGVRHEDAAAFAASGYAKAAGKPAACLTIAGPGATNLLTGIWDAQVDRVPLLALTGQVQTQVLGPGAFQEIDLASAFQAAAGWSQTVLHDSDHAELMSLAMKNALVNREPAHLVFPDEIQVLAAAESAEAGSPEGRLGRPEIAPAPASVDEAVRRMARAETPVILVGYGANGAMAPIVALAERLGAPILTTFKAKGQIGDEHPLAGGVLGRSGTPVAAACMASSDLLIVFGASFAQHTGIDAAKPTIQVDFDRLALAKFHPVAVPVWGEIGVTAKLLSDALPAVLKARDQRSQLASLWKDWRQEKAVRATVDHGNGLNSAFVFRTLSELLPDDAVISVDVGNNTYSFGRYFECSGDQVVLMSGYLGSIGFGFPAAMGAWAACPDRPILGGVHDRREVWDEDHPCPTQQSRVGQDLEGAARRQLASLADLAAQSQLR